LNRGLPGSGKTTLAQQQPAVHFEADMFFIKNEVYCFNAALLAEAHQWCESQTAATLQQGQAVVVSNTFIQWWQIEPYIQLAKRECVKVKLLEARGNYQNVHDVPAEVLVEMKRTYQSNKSIVANIKKILPLSQLYLPASISPRKKNQEKTL
jgi:predicted kinase